MATISDEHMAALYEKFILEYYRQHHGELNPSAAYVEWNLDEDNDDIAIKFLPNMKTDIMLKKGDRTLIIDAKYYTHTMQQNFDKYSLHSANMYQIFAYVKNMDKNSTGKVSGVLLYAKTEETMTPDFKYSIGGNIISASTLDLSKDFKIIEEKLENLITENL